MEFYEEDKKEIITALDEVVYKLNNQYSFVKNSDDPYHFTYSVRKEPEPEDFYTYFIFSLVSLTPKRSKFEDSIPMVRVKLFEGEYYTINVPYLYNEWNDDPNQAWHGTEHIFSLIEEVKDFLIEDFDYREIFEEYLAHEEPESSLELNLDVPEEEKPLREIS